MPPVLTIVLLLLVLLSVIVTVNTIRFKSPMTKKMPLYFEPAADMEGAQKLSEAVRIATIADMEPGKTDPEPFLRFHALLERQFPLVHKHLEKNVVNGLSLVYRWPAKNPPSPKGPVLITAHIDVVPVEPGTEKDWDYTPYSGELAQGRVWGRGTLDTKVHVIASLEAAERLLRQGYAPPRDIYFAFGHDEEVDGQHGAQNIVAYFAERSIHFDFLLDEGGLIADHLLSGVERPIALVGVGEKGYANIEISAQGDGGHSSMPPRHSALGIVAQALCRVEKQRHPARLLPPVREFLRNVGPEMGLASRIVLSNLWLFKPLFFIIFSRIDAGNALLRTTGAATMASAAPAPNILPQKARAVVNYRILPGQTGSELILSVRRAVKKLPVSLCPVNLSDPSALSPTDSEGYRLIENSIRQVCSDVIVTPYLVMASTDARKYEPVCRNIYRFTPYRIGNEELSKMHGTNENITFENVGRCISFFRILFENC